jgi:hypothetical protein
VARQRKRADPDDRERSLNSSCGPSPQAKHERRGQSSMSVANVASRPSSP